jgi:hypothetical protein
MDNKNKQRYNYLTNRLSYSFIKVITTFIIGPMVLMLFTPYGYLTNLLITIFSIITFKQIKKYYAKYRQTN